MQGLTVFVRRTRRFGFVAGRVWGVSGLGFRTTCLGVRSPFFVGIGARVKGLDLQGKHVIKALKSRILQSLSNLSI